MDIAYTLLYLMMAFKRTWFVFSLAVSLAVADYSRGFNADIDWLPLEEAKKVALEQHKPLFVLIPQKLVRSLQVAERAL